MRIRLMTSIVKVFGGSCQEHDFSGSFYFVVVGWSERGFHHKEDIGTRAVSKHSREPKCF